MTAPMPSRGNGPTRRAVLGGMAALGGLGASGAGAAGGRMFRRGIGVAHAMGWADIDPGGGFTFPPFANPGRLFSPIQIRTLRAEGFDFVRLAVDPGPFLQFTGARRDAVERVLYDTVRASLDGGLGIIVDFHPSDMHPDYISTKLTAGVDDPLFQAFLLLVARTAGKLAAIVRERRFDGARAPLALELMNEPEIDQSAWQPMLEVAYAAARAEAPLLPIVLGGGTQNAPDALEAMDIRKFRDDQAAIYTFHDYHPWQFTHQGAPGNPAFSLSDVPYPVEAAAMARAEVATTARIDGSGFAAEIRANERLAARKRLADYSRSVFDRRAMEAVFQRITDWRLRRGVPAERIFLGEFGIHLTPYQRTPDGEASRRRWLKDMREICEQHGFAWAAWAYAGPGGFALAENEYGPAMDPLVASALGLRR